jgi:hypothetical protein
MAGQSLSDYLLVRMREAAEIPTTEDFRARLSRRTSISPTASPTHILRAERDRR